MRKILQKCILVFILLFITVIAMQPKISIAKSETPIAEKGLEETIQGQLGELDLEDLERLIRDDTILVTIASVNSEVGVRQDLKKISEVVHKVNLPI